MPNAHFLGKKNHQELAKFYASADVFVFPSTSETYGNVIIEAMASGLPCVIADEGGSSSLVDHGITGFKAKAFDATDYSQYILKLINDNALKEQIIANGLSAIQKLDWQHLSNRYFQDIDNLANNEVYNTATLAWAN